MSELELKELNSLPVYPFLDEIAQKLNDSGTLLLSAEPGAGKTTAVPWHLLKRKEFQDKKILMLEPRRIAARGAADRIAALLNETAGQTAGLRTRLETVVSGKTRLEVVTEGILTRMLQNDPSLEGYGLIIFDEFHERSLQADLGLALAWEARNVFRPDLKILIMSATLPAAEIEKAYGQIPLISVPGRVFPVEVKYLPPEPKEYPDHGIARLVETAYFNLPETGGDILVFLPGFKEIRRTAEKLNSFARNENISLLTLHGSMPPSEQKAVLQRPANLHSRIILSTNVAETSLTLPGIKAVVDSGQERRARFDPRTGMNHLETVSISRSSAEQRKGRAGRLSPGFCYRYWKENEVLVQARAPEILEADLAPLALETALWGSEIKWITAPPDGAMRQARDLLTDLGLLDDDKKMTELGKRASQIGLHPRLARMVLEADKWNLAASAAVTAALLSDRDPLGNTNDPDFRERLLKWNSFDRVEKEAGRILRNSGFPESLLYKEKMEPESAGVLLLLAYPDRIAKRTRDEEGKAYHAAPAARYQTANGRGAIVTGSLSKSEFLVLADIDGGETDAKVFTAAPIERKDLESRPGLLAEKTVLNWEGFIPKAKTVQMIGKLILKEKPALIPETKVLEKGFCDLLTGKGWESLPWDDSSRRVFARLKFVQKSERVSDWPDMDDKNLLKTAKEWLVPFCNFKGGAVMNHGILTQALSNLPGWDKNKYLDEYAPESWVLPTGNRKRIDYETGDIPILAARLQEFFGCTENPKIAGKPLLLHLLSPAGRPLQVTQDLNGFWDNSYPDIKKEMKGRYPRHYWPDNPREAEPTSRAKPKK